MNGILARLNHGLGIIQLWIVFVALQIGGLAFLAMGMLDLSADKPKVRSAPRAIEGIVASKVERPIPGYDLKVYSVDIAPDRAPQKRLSRAMDKARWDTIAVGDRWSDPLPVATPEQAVKRDSTGSTIRGIVVGALMLMGASFIRRRIRSLQEAFNAPEAATTTATSPDLAKMLRDVLAQAATYKQTAKTAAGKSASTPRYPPTKTAPKPPVRRSATVTRAGWI